MTLWIRGRGVGRSAFGIGMLVILAFAGLALECGSLLPLSLRPACWPCVAETPPRARSWDQSGSKAHSKAALGRENSVAGSLERGFFSEMLAATTDTGARQHPKLGAPLADLVRAAARQQVEVYPAPSIAGLPFYGVPKSVTDALRTRRLRINQDGAVQVYILLDEVSKNNLRRLQGAGATLELRNHQPAMVQAHVSVARLEELESLPFVQFIRLPNYGIRHTGSVDTEGDAILRADQVRSQLHVDGTGVRVGVISDGLKGVFATGCTTCPGVAGGPISTGDLPDTTGTRNTSGVLTSSSGGITGQSFSSNHDLEGLPPASAPCGFPGTGAEGTALLEIVHDIAPGAQLFFANFDTSLAFKQAVNSLASRTDVVVDDIGFFGEPYDGTGDISTNTANALNSSTNPIRAYYTSVGNDADEHYLGAYADSGTDGEPIVGASGHLHLFQVTTDTVDVLGLGPQAYDKIELKEGGEVVVVLSWDDPFGSSTNDYDLFLVQESTGKSVASSTGKSCEGSQFPVECLDYTNETGAEDFFHIVIQNAGNLAAARNLNMFLFEPECAQSGPLKLAPGRYERHNYNTVKSSISAEADAGGSPASVVSVGAICSGSEKAIAVNASCGNDPDHTQIEYFSSNGPTVDGRTKPDVTAIDGVSITGAGHFENPFFGTSAAAPHAAGIAALLLQAAPCLLTGAGGARDNVTARMALHNLILNSAVPLGGSAPNNTYGSGRIDALASADQAVPTVGAVPNQTIAGNTPTGATVTIPSTGFSDPNQCPLTINATGECGGSGSSVNCPFGTSTVTLSATNNGVTFTSPVTVHITISNFKVEASPTSATVMPGQAGSYTVTVTPQLGAFPGAVELGCSGLPVESTCSFSPASVTPGTNRITSMLTLSTTAASALTLPQFRRWKTAPPPVTTVMLVGLLLLVLVILECDSLLPLSVRPACWLRSSLSSLWDWGREQACRVKAAAGCPTPKRIAYASGGVLLGFLLLQVACGGGSSGTAPPPNPGTPAGTYNINITGTSGTLVQSVSVSLVVQ